MSAPIGWMVIRTSDDGKGFTDDWDGTVHPNRQAAEEQLLDAQQAYAGLDWHLVALVSAASIDPDEIAPAS